MSEKTTCPACGVHLSSITIWLYGGDSEGSPCCGLSRSAFTEIASIRSTRADEALKERAAELVRRCDGLEWENARLRALVSDIEDLLSTRPEESE